MKNAPRKTDSAALVVSVCLYRCLLFGYPPGYREEYGPAMVQLFGDQCRDAWRDGSWWGLLRLWLRVLLDLIVTAVQERISTLKGRKNMMPKMSALFAGGSSPRRVFAVVFASVFVAVTLTSTLVTFIMPEFYCSAARVIVDTGAAYVNGEPNMPSPELAYDPYLIQTQFAVMRSDLVLGQVIEDLDLNRVWGKKYAGGNALSRAEAVSLLQARLELRPVRNTHLVEIRVFSDESAEAAKLANGIARTYQKLNGTKQRTEIVDLAIPGLMPVRPNKPLNIAVGVIGGALLALAGGGAMAWIVSRYGRKSTSTACT